MTKVKISTDGGIDNERWFESRRIWATLFTAATVLIQVSTVLINAYIPEPHKTVVLSVMGVIAGYLTIDSWVRKK